MYHIFFIPSCKIYRPIYFLLTATTEFLPNLYFSDIFVFICVLMRMRIYYYYYSYFSSFIDFFSGSSFKKPILCVWFIHSFWLGICHSLCFLSYIIILLVLFTLIFSEINIATCDFCLQLIEEKDLFVSQPSTWVFLLTNSIHRPFYLFSQLI